jgi:SAM-dependent MidA family methyltransferase
VTKLEEKIAGEIVGKGVISLARFMELALYCPVYGYYEKEGDKPGRAGDYFTSVSVGRLFGALLAFQFCEWLETAERGAPGWRRRRECRRLAPGCHAAGQKAAVPADAGGWPFQIVEAGAHDGDLAADILGWIQAERPGLADRVEYWIVEPSKQRQAWQRAALAKFGNQVHWAQTLAELAGPRESEAVAGSLGGVHGVIFSNELLDAFPAHRFSWDAGCRQWFEWGVTRHGDRFTWKRIEPTIANPRDGADGARAELAALLETARAELEAGESADTSGAQGNPFEWLPDGFTLDVCPSARSWWREAATALRAGYLVTFDYGYAAAEFVRPERQHGSLRGYHQHQLCSDPLERPGAQDLTVHVNFSSLLQAGQGVGLETEVFASQAQFLTGIASSLWNREGSLQTWPSELRRQFHTLTHPEHLGRAFRALVQSRRGSGDDVPVGGG